VTLETAGVIIALGSPLFYAGVFWGGVRRLRGDVNGLGSKFRVSEAKQDRRFRQLAGLLADNAEPKTRERAIALLASE
jgi:hypothetical protein